jgi:hypothetical protein
VRLVLVSSLRHEPRRRFGHRAASVLRQGEELERCGKNRNHPIHRGAIIRALRSVLESDDAGAWHMQIDCDPLAIEGHVEMPDPMLMRAELAMLGFLRFGCGEGEDCECCGDKGAHGKGLLVSLR